MNLTTERLHLRPFTPEDIAPFQTLCANPEVMRYIGPTTPEQLATSVHAWITAYDQHGYGLLAVEHRAEQRFGAQRYLKPSRLSCIVTVGEL